MNNVNELNNINEISKIKDFLKSKTNEIGTDAFSIRCHICDKEYFIQPAIELNNIANYLYKYSGVHIQNNNLYCKECYEQLNKILESIKEPYRPSKHNYYLNIAKEISMRSTCLRRRYGTVIVNNDIIISTGYNGSPRQTSNCIDLNYCRREKLNIPRGERYELCRAVHSEMNAIINASRESMIGATLYLYGADTDTNSIIPDLDSCQMCKKIIINSGISTVVFARPDDDFDIIRVDTWIKNDESLTDKMGY